jgi:hypothetical protein
MPIAGPDRQLQHARLDFLTVRRCETFILAVITVLVVMDLLSGQARTAQPVWRPILVWSMFNLSAERGVGTWFATIQLAGAGVLALLVSRVEESVDRIRVGRWWMLLGVLLIAASAEEILGFHEALDGYVEIGNLREQIIFTWVIPGAAVAALLGLLFARFVLTRPPPIRWRLLIGGCCFVAGAVGLEFVGGTIEASGGPRIAKLLARTMEEGLELGGAALVLSAVLRQLRGPPPLGNPDPADVH